MAGGRVAAVWISALLVLVSALLLVPWLVAETATTTPPRLTSVPDPVLRSFGIDLQAPMPPPPGCQQLGQVAFDFGRGRALAETVCPSVYGQPAAQRRAVEMGVPRSSITQAVHADCSVRVAQISHRDCWVVVVTGAPGSKRPGYTLSNYTSLGCGAGVGCKVLPKSIELVLIDARTDQPLATIALIYTTGSTTISGPASRLPDG